MDSAAFAPAHIFSRRIARTPRRTSRSRVRYVGTLLAGALFALSISSCSSSSTPAGAKAGSTTTSPKAPSRPIIKIGVYAPVASNSSGVSYPQIPAAVRAAVRAINLDGGFGKYNGQVDFCDTHEDPNVAAACARQFVSDHDVAVVGGFTTEGASLIPVLQDAGIANIGSVAINSEDSIMPVSFPLDGSLMAFPAEALQLAQAGAKKIYAVRSDLAATTPVPQLIGAAAKVGEAKMVGVGAVPLGAPDMTPYAAAAQASGADGVALALPDTDAVKFMLAAKALGYKPTYAYQEGGFTPHDLNQLGSLAQGMETPGPFPPVSAANQFPELKQFVKDMQAEYATGDQGAAPEYYGSPSIRPWLAVIALQKVIEDARAGPVTAATVLHGFDSVKDLDLGLIPPWTTSNHEVPIFPRISSPYEYYIKFENGRYVLISKTPVNIPEKVNIVSALNN